MKFLRVILLYNFKIIFTKNSGSTDIDSYLKDQNVQSLNGAAYWGCLALLVAHVQQLNTAGHSEQVYKFIDFYILCHGNIQLLNDIKLATEKCLNGKFENIAYPELMKNLAFGGLAYKDIFKNKFCGNPFNEFEVTPSGAVYNCCPSYLPYSIGNIYDGDNLETIKCGKKFNDISDSIINQDFRYCRWIECPKIQAGLPDLSDQDLFEYQPKIVRLSYDPTCNLSCPSCRDHMINIVGEERDRILKITNEVIIPLLENAESCMMNGYGDVFASRACREILQKVNSSKYQNLKFDFITNGLLFKSVWSEYPNIHNMINSVRVSIDAARPDTYAVLRRGGRWDKLLENLYYIADLRKKGIFEDFMISMVVQFENYNEMCEFGQLAYDLDVDHLVLENIMDWNVTSRNDYLKKAVHYPSHANHQEFRLELEKVIKNYWGRKKRILYGTTISS
jgi:sulfatase maturation enzyme AslB (radical SAM superfamily)